MNLLKENKSTEKETFYSTRITQETQVDEMPTTGQDCPHVAVGGSSCRSYDPQLPNIKADDPEKKKHLRH